MAVLALAPVFGAAAGCGHPSARPAATPAPERPAATPAGPTPAPTTATPATPVFDDLDGAPPITDTSGDLTVVTRSLLHHAEWMGAHRPDAAAIPAVALKRSPYERALTERIAALATENRREVIEREAPPDVTVLDHHIPGLATLRWVERGIVRSTVDPEGTVVESTRTDTVKAFVVLLQLPSGAWRIAGYDEHFWA